MKADTRPQWLQDLDIVETTPDQARQIIKRNRALLRELKKAEPKLLKKQVPEGWDEWNCELHKKVQIGCPHCDNYECGDECAWSFYESASDEPCSVADFAGICLRDIVDIGPIYLSYWHNKASITVSETRSSDLDDYKIQDIRDCIADIRKFLEAHITWGKDVLRRAKDG